MMDNAYLFNLFLSGLLLGQMSVKSDYDKWFWISGFWALGNLGMFFVGYLNR